MAVPAGQQQQPWQEGNGATVAAQPRQAWQQLCGRQQQVAKVPMLTLLQRHRGMPCSRHTVHRPQHRPGRRHQQPQQLPLVAAARVVGDAEVAAGATSALLRAMRTTGT